MRTFMGLGAIGMIALLGGCMFDHLNRLDQRRWLLDRHNDTAHLGASAIRAAS